MHFPEGLVSTNAMSRDQDSSHANKIFSLCNLGVYHTVSLSIVTTLCLGVPELPHLLAGNLYNDQHHPISLSSFCPTLFLEI